MVLTYALPLAIFVDIVSTARDTLVSDLPLLVVLATAIVGLYCVIFLACRFVFRCSTGMSALWAMAASAPNGPYVGPAVLGFLYGTASGIPIAVCSMLINTTVVPLTIVLISLYADTGALQPEGQSGRAGASPAVPTYTKISGKIVETLKKPLVWLPLLGFVIVLMNISIPALFSSSLALLGHAAAGIALFTAGIVLAAHRIKISPSLVSLVAVKNILQPALVWGIMLLLGYAGPLLSEAVVTAALPMLVLVSMLGVQYKIAETEAASALFVSMIGSVITLGAFIALTS